MTKGKGSWTSPATALTVTGNDISPQFVRSVLGIDRDSDLPPNVNFYDGSGWCALAVDDSYSSVVDEQVRELVRAVLPLVDRFTDLNRSGGVLHIDISGTAGTHDKLTVSPESLTLLSRLSLPVTFTTIANAEHFQEQDPLAWLDDL